MSLAVDLDGDHVLVLISGGRRVYHSPSDDDPDRPSCGCHSHGGTKWARRDPERILRLGACKMCFGTFDRGRGGRGSQLAARLRAMDVDEIGGDGA